MTLALVMALRLCEAQAAVEASAVYGLSGRPAFGALVGGTWSWDWAEFGLLGGYQAEPYVLYEHYLQGARVTGATHRVQVLATAGASWKVWRLALGAQLVGGWSHVVLHGTFVNEKWGVSGALDTAAGAFTLGAGLRITLRLSEHLDLSLRGLVPLPFASGVTGYATFALGVAYRF
ncbi:MAG: hypothetical protein Q8L48_38215 [Archangium sp.]|nr:hypothetical protein [Archangium sp.]